MAPASHSRRIVKKPPDAGRQTPRRLFSLFRWLRELLTGRPAAPRQLERDTAAVRWSFDDLAADFPLLWSLPARDKRCLPKLVTRFVDEKKFWGSRDLQVTEQMKAFVAAQACILILRLPHLGLFPKTKEIILYPSEIGDRIDAIGPDGETYWIEPDKIGETWHRGPVLLSWDRLQAARGNPTLKSNTVFHEFAHALDFLTGQADGRPPLDSPRQAEKWNRVMTSAYRTHIADVQTGRRTFIDPYGATNPAEFFAVCTEHFFTQPKRLSKSNLALYVVLARFYRQDPGSW